MNLLTRFNYNSIKRHWDEIKYIPRYLRGKIDIGLFFPNNLKLQLIGYIDAEYKLDPHLDE